MFAATQVFANIPGGGDGTGPNVSLTTSGNYVTLSNGVVTAKIQITTAQILELWYNGVQVTDGGTAANNAFYWQGNSGSSDTLTTIVNPATNGGNSAIIQLFDSHTNNSANADAYRYYAMFRGSPGLYAAEVMVHGASMPAGGADIPSLAGKLGGGGIFNWLAQDTGRNKLMQSTSDTAVDGGNSAPKEVTLLTSGRLAGQFDCKYDFSGELGVLGCTGWCSTGQMTNIGIWLVHPSNEYFTCGPKHAEILSQWYMLNSTFVGVHYGFHDDDNLATNENWAKVAGPFLIYLNKVAAGTTNPQTALYSDVLAQTTAERGAWPYSWLPDTNYVKAAGRGVVTGRIVIADGGNPNASASNLWVGLQQQPDTPTVPSPTDFQQWGKDYQYWVKSDANGNFTFTNVVAGTNYTVFAFGPGGVGLFESQPLAGGGTPFSISTPASPFSVTVNPGATVALGNVTWTPPRVGATVWEIGVCDRDTTEFRHGEDYWHGDLGNSTNYAVNWMPWQDFNSDFPNGVNYVVGASHWGKDWDYAHGSDLDPVTGNLGTSTWTVSFNLPNAPTGGASASIFFGIAASYAGPVIVKVNGTDIAGSTGFFPAYSDSTTADQAMIRMGSHGMASDTRINFSATLLHAGANTVTLNMRKGDYFSNMTMYDYIRLELSGYVPPAPANLSASSGNGLVSLWWPSAPGATSYDVLRSITSGSGYTAIATNIIGPTSGSVDDTAAFNDTNVMNGTTYYYVVRSVNPNGNNSSVQTAATPSAGTPGTPATPTNVTATAGNNFVTLKWNASPGASRYLIQRTVLTIGAATTYTPGGINPYAVINSYVTGTNYTDTALANNVTYSYLVSAANANGQSTNSAAISATPAPAIPNTPTGLSASVISNQITISWSLVTNASSYVVSRATALAGPYSIVDNPEPRTSSIDSGLNYTTTYYYKVAAASLGGISSNSVVIAATTTPPPPAPITAIPGNAQVFIDWGDSAGATNYYLQRSTTDGGPYSTIASTTNTSWLDTGPVNGTIYYYVAYATGTNGTSPLSAQAAAMPSATPQMIKADTTNMDASTDWSGVTPAIGQVGLFNNIISAANEAALSLGGDVTIGGLIFTNNLNGPVTVSSGNTLTLGSAGLDLSKVNQGVTFNNALLLATNQIWNVTNNQSLTVNGTFTSASNTVFKTGGGTLNLGTTVSDSGATIQVNAGTVQANASSGITISLNGGTFSVNVADSNPINVLAAGGLEQNVGGNRTWSGHLTGSGPLDVNASSVHTWSGDNSAYTGTITEHGSGSLRLSSVNSVSATTAYILNGTMNGNVTGSFNIGSLSGSGTLGIASGTPTWFIGALGASTIFGGNISGGAVIKTGTGIMTLTGASTFAGGTTISNGVLLVNNTNGSGTGTGAVVVNSGGTLGGNGSISGAVTVNSGGVLVPGMNGIGTLTFSNSLALASGSTSLFEISKSPFTNDVARIFGTLTNGGTLVVTNVGAVALTNGDNFKLFNASAWSGSFSMVVLPPLGGGLRWDTNALSTNGLVSVVAAPQPPPPLISHVSLSGGALVFSCTNGPVNATYYVLTSTNITVPVTNWTYVATNQVPANALFAFTNAISPGAPQAFYRVQVQ